MCKLKDGSFINFTLDIANKRKELELSWFDIILYSDIISLTNEKGYCYALNSYFSNKWNVSKSTITNSISSLKKANLIITKDIYEENTKNIKARHIYLTNQKFIEEK